MRQQACDVARFCERKRECKLALAVGLRNRIAEIFDFDVQSRLHLGCYQLLGLGTQTNPTLFQHIRRRFIFVVAELHLVRSRNTFGKIPRSRCGNRLTRSQLTRKQQLE